MLLSNTTFFIVFGSGDESLENAQGSAYTSFGFSISGSNYQKVPYLVFTSMAQSDKSRFSSHRMPLGSAYVLVQIGGFRNC